MKQLVKFIKKEIVFSIAVILATASAFITPPSMSYMDYIDFHTLALLLSLMLVVAGLTSCGLFNVLVEKLMSKVSNKRQLALTLVLLCFFSSMFITNDVALITFIPFTVMMLAHTDDTSYSIFLIVLETIAANLGSMFTPIGNPQNLYLFSLSKISIMDFLCLMLPYTLASLIGLIICVMLIKKEPIASSSTPDKANANINRIHLIIYLFLFVLCILTVLSIVDYRIMLILVLVVVSIVDIKLLPKADYILLLTFIAFFIFIGNIKNIPQVNSFLAQLITGRECIISIGASQIVSNVPAAMLLSGFTTKYEQLIIGTNLGGLGTLIASMASLISFKFYNKTKDSNTLKYTLKFTVMNIIFLTALLLLYFLINKY